MATDGSKDPFEQFLLVEYANLAQAFFNAGTSLTQFFQYYLIALGVPLTAAGIAAKVVGEKQTLAAVVGTPVGRLLAGAFLIIGVVGLCMAVYIINLRVDALLYARAVNGIRRYFYSQPEPARAVDQYRALSTDTAIPSYREPVVFFWPVVAAFALLNTTYVAISLLLLIDHIACVAVLAGLFLILHAGVYLAVTSFREKSDRRRHMTQVGT
jgi:hypothetical protein